MSRRSLTTLLVLVIVLLVSLAPAMAQEGGKFTFTGWSLQEGATRDVIMGVVAEYSQATGAEITDVSYPYNEYLNQILLQARGGNLSGAVQLDIAWLAPLAGLHSRRAQQRPDQRRAIWPALDDSLDWHSRQYEAAGRSGHH